MLIKAIEKIEAEMQQSPNNLYIQFVGKFMLGHLKANPGSAEKVLAEDKTIEKSLKPMEAEARKNMSNNVAMLSDEQGYAVVLKYFGIEAAAPQDAAAPDTVPDKKPVKFNVRLEDLI